MAKHWDPEEVLQMSLHERDFHNMSPFKNAERLMYEHSDVATKAILHIAMYSDNEKLRFDAARYILERVLGRTPEFAGSDANSKLMEMVDELVVEA